MKKILTLTLCLLLMFISIDAKAYHHIGFQEFENDFINNSSVLRQVGGSVDTTTSSNECIITSGNNKIVLIYNNGFMIYDLDNSVNDGSDVTVRILKDVLRRLGVLYGYSEQDTENFINIIKTKDSTDGAVMDYDGNTVNEFEVSLLSGFRGLMSSLEDPAPCNPNEPTPTTPEPQPQPIPVAPEEPKGQVKKVQYIENPSTGDYNTAIILVAFGVFTAICAVAIFKIAKKDKNEIKEN